MKKIFSIVLAALAMSSCVDTVILPENKTLDEDFWKKKSEVKAVVAAAYAQLRDGATAATSVSFQRNIIVWSDFRSDELQLAEDFKTSSTMTDALKEINSMQIQPNNTFTKWSPLYSCINYCNLVLEKGQDVMNYDPDFTEGEWLTTKAQVTALRALCYFYLVRVFRDVPVTPHAYLNSSDDLNVEQSAPTAVLAQCISDLESVVNDAPLTDAYTDDSDNRGLMGQDAINSLLADIYLWRASVNHDAADYQKCIDYCDKVIAAKKAAHKTNLHGPNAGTETEQPYYLADASDMYNEIFGQGGQGTSGQNAEESIFELQYKANSVSNTALMNMYYGYSKNNSGYGYLKTTPIYACSNAASGESNTNLFKNNYDQRLFDFCYNANESSASQYVVRKFCADRGATTLTSDPFSSGRSTWTQDWIIYRLTDIMLMKAEALVQLDQLQDAFDLVKFVNDRAIGTNTSVALKFTLYNDKTKMEKLVLLERARELCFEGKRWFDLLRYNYRYMTGVDYSKKLTEMGGAFANNSAEFYALAFTKYGDANAMKAKMPTEAYLYMPINEDELKNNTFLVQNPVYKSTSN